MFNDYIELKKQDMINDLMRLVSIPSVISQKKEDMPFGKDINDALEEVTSLAKKMGFKAKNLGYCSEITFGQSKGEKVYIAGHVDVVPSGDGWTSSPYQLSIRNGKMYGRGVLDDKGPVIAVLYALKAIKELGYKPKSQIKLIVGGNEENGMSDLEEYVDRMGLCDFALTPDSTFPIVNAEAGILHGDFVFENTEEKGEISLVSLDSGNAYNSVPDICRAVILVPDNLQNEVKLMLSEREFMNTDIEYYFNGNMLCLTVFGVSAHGSVPEKGDNALKKAVKFISLLLENNNSKNGFVSFIKNYFEDDTKGEKLGIFATDDILGDLSVNLGICEYKKGEQGKISIDIRLPIRADKDKTEETLREIAKKHGGKFETKVSEPPFYIPEDSEFLQKLSKCYEEVTGKKSRFIAARGGTYAKSFRGKGVAFGPIDEENPEEGGNMHSADEYLSVKAFCDLAKIYALSIYELWVK